MDVTVQIEGLYNHETCKNYKKGLQKADNALMKLAKKQSRNDAGVILVLAPKGTKFDEDDKPEETSKDIGNPPDNSNDNVDIALRNGLDLNDKLQTVIHKLLNGEGLTYSAITRAMGDDSKKPAKVVEWRDKSLPVIEKLEGDGAIHQEGKKWFYVKDDATISV